MDRYIFFDPGRVPPGLHVIGVPTVNGLVWVEITEAEVPGRGRKRRSGPPVGGVRC